MEMGHQPQSATAGYGTGASRPIPVHGAISEMGIRRQWPPQKHPSCETGETGETGGRVICLALLHFPDAHKYRGVLPVFGRSCKGSSKQFIMATGALEKGDAVI